MLALAIGLAACSQVSEEAKVNSGVTPQFGTAQSDTAAPIVVSQQLGAFFVGGTLNEGVDNPTARRPFVRRYSNNGALWWTRFPATTRYGGVTDMELASDNSVWVGFNIGSPQYGGRLYRYSATGSKIGQADIKGPGGCGTNTSGSLANLDINAQGDVFALMVNTDCGGSFIAKFNTRGQQVATYSYVAGNQFELANDGAIYVVTAGGGSNYKGEIQKKNLQGDSLWEQSFPIPNYDAFTIHAASDGVYVAGYKQFSNGERDARITKLNDAGKVVWNRTFGTPEEDYAYKIDVDSQGSVYVTGSTFGQLPNNPAFGEQDMFVRKYTAGGAAVWTKQLGSAGSDSIYGVAVNSLNDIYLSGATTGDLGAGNKGSIDAFVMRLNGSGDKVWVR